MKTLSAPPVMAVLLGVAVALAIAGLRSAGALESVELKVYDEWLRWSARGTPTDPRIVIVGINEQDIHSQGRWPLTDATLAEMLNRIAAQRPRAIGLDIYRDFAIPPGSQALERTFKSHRNIVAVMKYGGSDVRGIPGPPAMRHTSQMGFNDIVVDSDGIVRRGLLFLNKGDAVFSSFALTLALLYLEPEGIRPVADPVNPEFLRLGRTTFPPFESNDGAYIRADARGYQFLARFNGTDEPFTAYTLDEVLREDIARSALKDKVVLIGVVAESVPDSFHTPYQTSLKSERGTEGVILHAHFVSQLLRGALDKPAAVNALADKWEWLMLFIASLGGGLVGLQSKAPLRFALLTIGGVGLLGWTGYAALEQQWWIPTVPPVMGWIGSAGVVTAFVSGQERRQRAVLMKLFSQHVSSQVAETIWQQRDQFIEQGRLKPQKLVITVLFVDLSGFTAVSEKMEPQELLDWLNGYIEVLATVIMAHGGVVDDYAGDAIKADFGVPVPRTTDAEIAQDAVNAVTCAVAMKNKLQQLNLVAAQQHRPIVGMRIGIFTGPVVAGSLGSTVRLKYTTLGDTVNTAARLESFDRERYDSKADPSHCRILLGQVTVDAIGDRFQVERMGDVQLKGKAHPITVYRLKE